MRSPRTLNMTSSVSMVWRKLSIVVMTTSLCMLAQQLIAVDAAHWGSFSQAKCISPGYMKYYSRLWDIQGDWSTACKEAPATINGVYYTSPENCVDKGVSGMWGEWKVEDSSCNTNWGSFQDDGCKSNGCRQFSSIIWDIPSGVYWEDWCQQSSADVSLVYSRSSRMFPSAQILMHLALAGDCAISPAVLSMGIHAS